MQPTDLTREEVVSQCLRKCALEVDPRYGHLKALADEFGWHSITLSVWIRNGRVPEHAAVRLKKRFPSIVDVDSLVHA